MDNEYYHNYRKMDRHSAGEDYRQQYDPHQDRRMPSSCSISTMPVFHDTPPPPQVSSRNMTVKTESSVPYYTPQMSSSFDRSIRYSTASTSSVAEVQQVPTLPGDIYDENSFGETPCVLLPLTPGTKIKMNQALYTSFSQFEKERCRLNIPKDPYFWTNENVIQWLEWLRREYHLGGLNHHLYRIHGQQLCQMGREDFLSSMQHFAGEICYEHLDFLRREAEKERMPNPSAHHGHHHHFAHEVPFEPPLNSNLPTYEETYNFGPCLQPDNLTYAAQTPTPPEYYPTGEASHHHVHSSLNDAHVHDHPSSMMPSVIHHTFNVHGSPATPDLLPLQAPAGGPVQLWQFLLELLTDKHCQGFITWTGDGWEFKLLDPDEVAKRWGIRKNKPKMNYEKLSRGLRYYYDKNIIHKTAGKRYVYRFVCDLQGVLGLSYDELFKLVELQPQKELKED